MSKLKIDLRVPTMPDLIYLIPLAEEMAGALRKHPPEKITEFKDLQIYYQEVDDLLLKPLYRLANMENVLFTTHMGWYPLNRDHVIDFAEARMRYWQAFWFHIAYDNGIYEEEHEPRTPSAVSKKIWEYLKGFNNAE